MVKDGDVKCIYNEGMPQYKNPFEKGKMIVKFSIEFPSDNWTNEDNIAKLEKILPARQEVSTHSLESPPHTSAPAYKGAHTQTCLTLINAFSQAIIPDDAEECALHKFDPRTEGPGRRPRRGEAFMEDDDDDGLPGQRVQCASH